MKRKQMQQPIYDSIVDELEKMIPVLYEELEIEEDWFSNLPVRYQAELMVNQYIKRIMNV